MSKYAIWDKESTVITPSGAMYNSQEWIDKYPIAALPNITIVCGAGVMNGSFFGVLEQMVHDYTNRGCDFSTCQTNEEKLAKIEEFDEQMRNIQTQSDFPSTAESLASISASLEYQNMMSLANLPEEEII